MPTRLIVERHDREPLSAVERAQLVELLAIGLERRAQASGLVDYVPQLSVDADQ